MPTPSPESQKPVSLRFKIGVLLLLINVPFGLVGVALGTALYAKTHHFFWQAVGIGLYALSWGMLGLGVWLAGPDGKRLAGEMTRQFMGRFKRKE